MINIFNKIKELLRDKNKYRIRATATRKRQNKFIGKNKDLEFIYDSKSKYTYPITLKIYPSNSSYVFIFLWLLIPLLIYLNINKRGLSYSLENFILYLAIFVCLLNFTLTLLRFFLPYIVFWEDHLDLYFAILRKISIPYDKIITVNYSKEEADIYVKGKNKPRKISLILRYLTFDDQDLFMDIMENKNIIKP